MPTPVEWTATEQSGTSPRAAAHQPVNRRDRRLEVAALLLLAVGAFVVPVVPLLVGLALVFASRQWSTGTEGFAAALVVLPALLLPAFSVYGGAFRLPGAESLFALYTFGPVGGLLGTTLLAVTLGRHPGPSPGCLRPLSRAVLHERGATSPRRRRG